MDLFGMDLTSPEGLMLVVLVVFLLCVLIMLLPRKGRAGAQEWRTYPEPKPAPQPKAAAGSARDSRDSNGVCYEADRDQPPVSIPPYGKDGKVRHPAHEFVDAQQERPRTEQLRPEQPRIEQVPPRVSAEVDPDYVDAEYRTLPSDEEGWPKHRVEVVGPNGDIIPNHQKELPPPGNFRQQQ